MKRMEIEMEVMEKPETALALTLPQRAAAALATPEQERKLRELVQSSSTIVEIKNQDGREQCHSALMRLRNLRFAVDHTVKDATEDAKAFTSAVKVERDRLIGISSPEEDRLQLLRDDWDLAKEAAKKQALAIERQRIESIKARITEITETSLSAVGKTLSEIESISKQLSEIQLDESFEEFLPGAKVAHANSMSRLQESIDAAASAEIRAREDAIAREAETNRLAEERAELERKKAAQENATAEAQRILNEERAKFAREREVEEEKAEKLRKEAEAKLSKQREELKIQQAAIDEHNRKQKAIADAEQKQRDDDAAAAAAVKKAQEDEAAKIAKQKEDAERAERERVANVEHIKNVHLRVATVLQSKGLDLQSCDIVISLLVGNEIPHVTLNY